MVSFRGQELRVHQGYLTAPMEVHQAIVAFVEGRTRAERRAHSAESSRMSSTRRAVRCAASERAPKTSPRRATDGVACAFQR
jgi:hypothetical protein